MRYRGSARRARAAVEFQQSDQPVCQPVVKLGGKQFVDIGAQDSGGRVALCEKAMNQLQGFLALPGVGCAVAAQDQREQLGGGESFHAVRRIHGCSRPTRWNDIPLGGSQPNGRSPGQPLRCSPGAERALPRIPEQTASFLTARDWLPLSLGGDCFSRHSHTGPARWSLWVVRWSTWSSLVRGGQGARAAWCERSGRLWYWPRG